jgi:hypothetical protein
MILILQIDAANGLTNQITWKYRKYLFLFDRIGTMDDNKPINIMTVPAPKSHH